MWPGAALSCLLVAGCATEPSHPALADAQLPALIPVRDFVASRQSTGSYRVSPDGRLLAWMGIEGVRPAIWVRTLGQEDSRAFPVRARHFRWSADSQYLLATVDRTGDENTHVHAVAVQGADSGWTDLTPFENAASEVLQTVQGGPEVMVATNRRDKKVFDLHRVDPRTGAHTVVAANPGNVAAWGVDRQGRLRTRLVVQDGQSRLQRPDASQPGGWAQIAEWDRFEWARLLDFDPSGQVAWALSNRGRDKVALVRLDLANGAETVVHASPEVDVDNVLISRRTHQPLIAYSLPAYPHREVFDATLRQRLAPLAGERPAEIAVASMDDAENTLVATVGTDRGSRSYLLSADGGAPVLLGESRLGLLEQNLVPIRPVALTSRDGLALHGYLTLPRGVEARRLPMVLLVHGGPWRRDRWADGTTSRAMQQFLANRGYAVLQINYRGSSGYGRDFMEKARGEFAGKMHDDLIDGVRWAVQQGIADPERVAIYGASYGGYAALVGATFTPEVFACAVDVVGLSHLARFLETVPAYWEMGIAGWHRYIGDPARPEDRRAMDAKSPLFKVGPRTSPLLIMHGVNDPRVKLEQSELMVAALKKAQRPVDYVTFQGDGHGNQKWTNNLTMYRKTEDFLARCLGGRTSGFDYYQLGAWAF
jgi:dipeptidyl aminopeptidase/acylaminoacyl peptidase